MSIPLPELLILTIVPVAFAFWVWMLIDCVKHEPATGNDRLVWVIIILFAQVIGALIYYFVRHCERAEATNSVSSPPTPPASAANPL